MRPALYYTGHNYTARKRTCKSSLVSRTCANEVRRLHCDSTHTIMGQDTQSHDGGQLNMSHIPWEAFALRPSNASTRPDYIALRPDYKKACHSIAISRLRLVCHAAGTFAWPPRICFSTPMISVLVLIAPRARAWPVSVSLQLRTRTVLSSMVSVYLMHLHFRLFTYNLHLSGHAMGGTDELASRCETRVALHAASGSVSGSVLVSLEGMELVGPDFLAVAERQVSPREVVGHLRSLEASVPMYFCSALPTTGRKHVRGNRRGRHRRIGRERASRASSPFRT